MSEPIRARCADQSDAGVALRFSASFYRVMEFARSTSPGLLRNAERPTLLFLDFTSY